MARTDYGAIQSTVIKDTSDSIREVNGTSALIAPSAWGTQIRTMVSGAKYQQALDNFPVITIPQTPLASFDNGAGNVPFKEILAYIQATQAGTGDPSPSNPRAISGWSGTNVTVEKNNILEYANNSQSGTIAGVDYSFSNGRIVLNGTTTGRFSLSLDLAQSTNMNPTANKIMFRNNQVNTNVLVYFRRSNTDVHYWTMNTINRVAETWTDTGNENVNNVTITILANTTLSNFVFFPLLCEKTYTPTTYPITWQTEAGTVYGGYLNVGTGLLTVDKLIKDLGTLDYTYVASGNRFTNSGSGIAGEVRLPASDSQLANIMCDKLKPMSLTALRSSGDDYLIAIGDTGRISIRWTATQDPIAFKTAITGTNLVYELATPQTVQLTPAQIEQLLGQNNVFCSTGDVAVKYYSIGGEIPSGNPVTILEDGVVSANASYQVATFDDISDFGVIVVSLNDGGTEHPDCVCTTVQSIIDNGGTINLPGGFNGMRVQLTLTSITLTWYDGSWRTVTADIKGWR